MTLFVTLSGDKGNVSLECKVIGIPQPTLTWFKDGKELKAGDLHQLLSGSGVNSDPNADPKSCALGTYECMAENCMGKATSTATLIGFGTDFVTCYISVALSYLTISFCRG